MRRLLSMAAIAATLVTAAAAQASVHNGIQPGAAYFGKVKAGQHPTKVLTVHNGSKRTRVFRKFLLSGAGGSKFTLVGQDAAGDVATCRIGTHLLPHESCTLIIRVKTTTPEWWQDVVMLYYSNVRSQKFAGQFNGAAFVHIVSSN